MRDLALKEACESQLVVFHIGLSGSASDSRSQIQNHAAALFRLRLRFALELRLDAMVERELSGNNDVSALGTSTGSF